MYNTPASNRLHIGIFGRRNLGKSSLINALTSQDMAIVSETPGTTTDPVSKAMEILPIGPCMLIDTAGIDDTGELGKLRVEATYKVLRKTDVAILLFSGTSGAGTFEEEMIKILREKKIPFILCINKCDIEDTSPTEKELSVLGLDPLRVSCVTGEGIEELKARIIKSSPEEWAPVPLVKDILKEGSVTLLVCPIDGAMPKGRLILPQVQVLRDVLDSGNPAIVARDTELKDALSSLTSPPGLVITDTQVFEDVAPIVPEDVPLTSFSIVFARHKGDLDVFVSGLETVKNLRDGDEVLIAEACTHHVQPEDIARSKIPVWLREYTGKNLEFEVVAGGDFPDRINRYKLVIMCGGCMVNRREVQYRIAKCLSAGIPVTNYGTLAAFVFGILDRVTAPFGAGL